MRLLLTILTILLTSPLWSQEPEIKIFEQDSTKLLIRITDKDTIIYDTMGTIRYLFKLYDGAWERMQLMEKRMERALEVLENMNGIMFYQPDKRQKFNYINRKI